VQTLTSLVIPVAVFVVMWIVGLDLTSADFRRITRYPRATLVGTAGQLVRLPVVATLLILFLRPAPAIVGGVILIASAPSGAISNLLTLLARGNAALSVTLTGVSNTLGVAALAVTLTISVMFVGLGTARLTGLPITDGAAFVMEFSARNTAIALVVAVTTLGRPDYAMFIVAYFLVQMLVTIPVIGLLRRVAGQPPYQVRLCTSLVSPRPPSKLSDCSPTSGSLDPLVSVARASFVVVLAAQGVPDSAEKHSDADARHDQSHQPRHHIEAVLPEIRNQLV
jgi:predicted Na+-dependent transporter